VIGPFLRRLAREAAWAPISVVILHAVAGAIFGHEPYVDTIMHFLGGVAMAYFIHRACELGPDVLGHVTLLGQTVLVFAVTCTAATFWEFGEFARDRLFDSNVQLSLANTMRDLLLGCLGALVFLAFRGSVRSSSRLAP
jgi:hypothetical protein